MIWGYYNNYRTSSLEWMLSDLCDSGVCYVDVQPPDRFGVRWLVLAISSRGGWCDRFRVALRMPRRAPGAVRRTTFREPRDNLP